MSSFPAAVGRAMTVQVNRTRREPTLQEINDDLRVQLAAAQRELKAAQNEIKRLNAENDKLAVRAHRVKKTDSGALITGQFHKGIEYVNQVEACAILGMPAKEQYRISRWIKAGKFEMMSVPGLKKKQIVRASLHKPERGQPGRKKK